MLGILVSYMPLALRPGLLVLCSRRRPKKLSRASRSGITSRYSPKHILREVEPDLMSPDARVVAPRTAMNKRYVHEEKRKPYLCHGRDERGQIRRGREARREKAAWVGS